MAQRVQRSRRAGEPGMPAGAVYVGRPSRWGNPYRPGPGLTAEQAVARYAEALRIGVGPHGQPMPTLVEIRTQLPGRDLVCWCAPAAACHADVLMRVAAGEPPVQLPRRSAPTTAST